MDAAGWASVNDVLRVTDMTLDELSIAVTTNDKGRLQLEGARIRACQGHSLENMPVTRVALEASWEAIAPVAPLWHGTSVEALPGIGRLGITPSLRTHVHLADSVDSKLVKRARVDVLIEIAPEPLRRAGLGIFRAQNGVVLVERVPVESIVLVHPVRTDRRSVATACRTAGLPHAAHEG